MSCQKAIEGITHQKIYFVKLLCHFTLVTTAMNTALIPVPKLEEDCYDWYQRHEAVLALRKTLQPEIVLIGDSITHFWAGPPTGLEPRGPESWRQTFGDRPVLNLGFGWDRTQNMLWRLENGEFEGLQPKLVIILAGTNNTS